MKERIELYLKEAKVKLEFNSKSLISSLKIQQLFGFEIHHIEAFLDESDLVEFNCHAYDMNIYEIL